jgi:hypothetical protein
LRKKGGNGFRFRTNPSKNENILTFQGDNYINGWFAAMECQEHQAEKREDDDPAGLLVFGSTGPAFWKGRTKF